MKLECFLVDPYPPALIPGQTDRAWMDRFAMRHPYKCLPLTMANTTGWELQCPIGVTAEWNGGAQPGDIKIWLDGDDPRYARAAESHFGGGVLTFHTGYIFRTEPGWATWAMGPPNHVKDGIQPLIGLVETDWLPFPFTMNWIFTRPGRVRFEPGEPFCFITLMEHGKMEKVQPVLRDLQSDQDFLGQYTAWRNERRDFTQRLVDRDPEAVKQAWQRFYFKGEMPDVANPGERGHVNKRRLQTPKPEGGR